MVNVLNLFSGIGLGSWPDWVGAVGTSMAFGVAALAYRQSVLLRKESQARLVYCKISHTAEFAEGEVLEPLPNGARIGNASSAISYDVDPLLGAHAVTVRPAIQATVKVHNGSGELISPIKIQMVDLGLGRVIEDTCILTSGPVEPGTDYVVAFTLENPHYPGSPSLGAKLLFRDASGRWWRRYLMEPVEEVHSDPENATYTPSERRRFAVSARAMGMEPTPEPKVSWRVRLHRLRRRLLGKSTIP